MLGLVAAGLAGYGALLCYTSLAFGWNGIGPGAKGPRGRPRQSLRTWLDDAGMDQVGVAEFVGAATLLFLAGALVAFLIFGGPLPAVVAGLFCAGLPPASYRARRARRRAIAQDSWPRLLEELRLLTGSTGRSIPQGLFEVGRHAPPELRSAFRAAEREWLLTTDFTATAAVLRHRLADPTADAVAETLVIAHEVGGGDVDHRLANLIEDRTLELQGRKDAATKQAGVRFARRFVLLVPLGMAAAGLAIGTGRHAYQTEGGQIAVAAGILAVALCWWWSGRLLRLPEEERVFSTDTPAADRAGRLHTNRSHTDRTRPDRRSRAA